MRIFMYVGQRGCVLWTRQYVECDVVTVAVVIFSNNALWCLAQSPHIWPSPKQPWVNNVVVVDVFWQPTVSWTNSVLCSYYCYYPCGFAMFFRINRQELSWLPTNQKTRTATNLAKWVFHKQRLIITRTFNRHRHDMLMDIVWSIIKLSRRCCQRSMCIQSLNKSTTFWSCNPNKKNICNFNSTRCGLMVFVVLVTQSANNTWLILHQRVYLFLFSIPLKGLELTFLPRIIIK